MNKTLDSILYAFSLGWWCDPILGVVYKPDGQPAKQYIGCKGYFVVNLPRRDPVSPKSTWKSVQAHRVVAYCRWGLDAFAGHAITQVRHLDGIRTNNSYGNLMLGTPTENALDISREARSARSAKRWASLTEEQKSSWLNKIGCGFKDKLGTVVTGVKAAHALDPFLSRVRLDYARDIRYGRINKALVPFKDYFSKAQQAYTEGKNGSQGQTGVTGEVGSVG